MTQSTTDIFKSALVSPGGMHTAEEANIFFFFSDLVYLFGCHEKCL
jgi:hypothetical protein